MTKKDYVLALLKKLEPYRNVLTGIIAMIELGKCSDEDIEQLIVMIESQIKNIKNEKLKEKFRQAQSLLVQLKEKEIIVHQQDQKDADVLLAQIANL
ncbi:MAG: hypothetical protein LBU27_01415 [Candidatus Peribacteria bacterium]|jgi:ferredoxin-fold anticodon binding domain-containing protein|nr:hypothetical protein [Candidatus Peribacteria bacterium]